MVEEARVVAVNWWELVNAGSVLRKLLEEFAGGLDVGCEKMKSRMPPILLA